MNIDTHDKGVALAKRVTDLVAETNDLASAYQRIKEDRRNWSPVSGLREFTDDQFILVRDALFSNYRKLDAIALIMRN